MSAALIGIIGGLFILFAWIFETEESMRKHKKMLDLRFAAVYLSGLLFLTIYAYTVDDPIFFWLEIAIMLIVVFEIFYTMHLKVFKETKKKRNTK